MIEVCVASETGACRRVNEDRGFADERTGLLAVFDASGADGASADIALELTQTLMLSAAGNAVAALQQLAVDIDTRIRGSVNPKITSSPTTFLVALVRDGSLTVAHVGDGRAYLFRDGALRQLSKDHTLAEDLTDRGILSRDEAMNARNSGVITRALGFGANSVPDVIELETQRGDLVLLCTDGVWKALDTAQLVAAITGGPFAQAAARITELAASPGQDNSTAAVARIAHGRV